MSPNQIFYVTLMATLNLWTKSCRPNRNLWTVYLWKLLLPIFFCGHGNADTER